MFRRGLLCTAFLAAGCGGVDAPPPPARSVAPAHASQVQVASASPPSTVAFAGGCPEGAAFATTSTIALDATRGPERWRWACRAESVFGASRRSPYPGYRIHDVARNACIGLDIGDGGAVLYSATASQADALRAFLAAVPQKDCTFERDLEGRNASPMRGGVRDGKPFDEPAYDLSTLEGTRRYFEEHPNDRSSYEVMKAMAMVPKEKRSAEESALFDRAMAFQIDHHEQQKDAMIQMVGVQLYCESLDILAKHGPHGKNLSRLTDLKKRACTSVKPSGG